MAKSKKDIASVLAFEKKLVPSDGYMYGTTWKERNEHEATPLSLYEKSVRGTISNRLKKTMAEDPAKLNAEVEKANLQTVDSCSLGVDQDTLKLNFTLKVLSGVEHPSACNNADFNGDYWQVAKAYIEKYGFRELAKRYATNIANARYLWRNRVGAENLEVKVGILNRGEDVAQSWQFDARAISIRDFDRQNPDIDTLANQIAQALSGEKNKSLLLDITAYAQIGKAQEIYPSEELVLDKGILDKGKGKKSKILYQVNKQAAMHSQKIGNAIRSIDTWYLGFADSHTAPIAIEPYGAVTNLGVAYRNPTSERDFYTLFDKYVRDGSLESEEQEHYVMAVLVRGGVFGERSYN